MEPGVESLDVAQAWQAAPGVDQGILGRILRKVGVTKDESGDGVQPIDGACGQDAEGLAVSVSCPVHELRLHAWLLPKSTTYPVIYTLVGVQGISVQTSFVGAAMPHPVRRGPTRSGRPVRPSAAAHRE